MKNKELLEEKMKTAVYKFAEKKVEVDSIEKEFAETKKKFYEEMEYYYEQGLFDSKGITLTNDSINGLEITKAIRVATSKINFDVDSIEEMLGSKLSKSIVEKSYSVSDFKGLIKYLKECGVDPKEFKKYLTTTKIVNEKVLNKLFETGVVSLKDLEGCYTIEEKPPYYRVSTTIKKAKAE